MIEPLEVTASRTESSMVSPTEKLAAMLMEGDRSDPLFVRDAMLRVAALDHEMDELGKIVTAIAERYRVKGERLKADRDLLRGGIETFLIRFTDDGKASYPDAGTAYLQTTKAKLEIVDKDAVEKSYAKAKVSMPTKPEEIDWKQVKETLLARLLDVGELAPGCELIPESKSLRIRSASA